MKLQDLPAIDSAVMGQAGLVLEVDPGKADSVPFWTEMGGGMVAMVRYQNQAYMASKILPEWLVLIPVSFKEA